ncbi:MAG: hypothetical protein IRZ00_16715 [Gemmatimonadetes bacterium]|nr:hypothetical protein [Gemmatimonadota bacterium]
MLALTLGAAAPAAAQRLPRPEIGTQLGLTILDRPNSDSDIQLSVPGGRVVGLPTIYATLFLARHVALEPHANVLHVFGNGFSGGTRFAAAANLVALTDGGDVASPYALVGAALYGDGNDTYGAFTAGIGYRTLAVGRLAVRAQAQYRRWPSPELTEVDLTVGLGIRLGSDRGAAPRGR